MKKGLILEGGSMRGLFSCGIIDVFLENGITFDGAVGVSAGAVFGCNLKSEQKGRALRYNKMFCKDKRYASMRNFIKTGDVYGADFCYREIPDRLDVFDKETFAANPMDFYIVATDVETGRPVYHKCKDGGEEDIQWMRASASMPLASKIVELGGRKLLDGGMADSIPVKFLERRGFDRNVAILTQPLEFVKKKNKFLGLIRIVYRKFPNLIKSIATRHLRYNRTIEYIRERELAGELLVIRPSEALNIGSVEHDPDELDRVYEIGRKVALERLDEIKAWVGM
ncbi:MAG: patatin family protein [Lachnospiraceae bacterium]|nr:patatin family protein [Lachnospiraceae bacterium]